VGEDEFENPYSPYTERKKRPITTSIIATTKIIRIIYVLSHL